MILRWRDYNVPDVDKLELIQAQEQVELTQKILDAKTDEQAEQLRKGGFKVHPGGAAE